MPFTPTLLLSVFIGLMLAMMNALLGSKTTSNHSTWQVIRFALAASFLGSIALAGELALLPLLGPDPVPAFNFAQFAMSASIMFAASGMFMPFVIIGGRKRAANMVATVNRISAFALSNFDRLAEGADASKLITAESLTKLLRDPSTSQADREAISYLRANLADFGHQVGEEHYFSVVTDKTTDFAEKRAPIFAATRSEIETWPLKVADAKRSWLPSK